MSGEGTEGTPQGKVLRSGRTHYKLGAWIGRLPEWAEHEARGEKLRGALSDLQAAAEADAQAWIRTLVKGVEDFGHTDVTQEEVKRALKRAYATCQVVAQLADTRLQLEDGLKPGGEPRKHQEYGEVQRDGVQRLQEGVKWEAGDGWPWEVWIPERLGGAVMEIIEGGVTMTSFITPPATNEGVLYLGKRMLKHREAAKLLLEEFADRTGVSAWRDGETVLLRWPHETDHRHRWQGDDVRWIRVDIATGAIVGLKPLRGLEPDGRRKKAFRPGKRPLREREESANNDASTGWWTPRSTWIGWIGTEDRAVVVKGSKKERRRRDRDAREMLGPLTASADRKALEAIQPELATLEGLWRMHARPDRGARLRERFSVHPGLGEAVMDTTQERHEAAARAIEANLPSKDVLRLAGGGREAEERRMARGVRPVPVVEGDRELERLAAKVAESLRHEAGSDSVNDAVGDLGKALKVRIQRTRWKDVAGPRRAEALLKATEGVLCAAGMGPAQWLEGMHTEQKRVKRLHEAVLDTVSGGGAVGGEYHEPWGRTTRQRATLLVASAADQGWEDAGRPALAGWWDALEWLVEDVVKWRMHDARLEVHRAEQLTGLGMTGITGRLGKSALVALGLLEGRWRPGKPAVEGGWGRLRRYVEGMHGEAKMQTRLDIRTQAGAEAEHEHYPDPVGWTEAVREAHPHAVRLRSTAMLKAEGSAMQHCVGGYGDRVATGQTDVWHLGLPMYGSKGGATLSIVERQDPGKVRYAISELSAAKNRRATGEEVSAAKALVDALNAAAAEMPKEQRKERTTVRTSWAVRAKEEIRRNILAGDRLDLGDRLALAEELGRRVYKGMLPDGLHRAVFGGTQDQFTEVACYAISARCLKALQLAREVEAQWPGRWAQVTDKGGAA